MCAEDAGKVKNLRVAPMEHEKGGRKEKRPTNPKIVRNTKRGQLARKPNKN
jgi:hypothetical protein